jgi:hypothetical protein
MRLVALALCCLAIRSNSLAVTASNNLAARAHTSLAAGGDDLTTTLHNSIKEIATGVAEHSVCFVDNI